MKLLVPREHVAVQSSSLTNCTEPITNRLKLNKQGRHWPARTTGQEKTNKAYSLSTNSQISNSGEQSNTLTQGKTCSSRNSRKERYLTKRVTYLQKEKQNRQPYYCSFPTRQRISSPSSRQTVCLFKSLFRTIPCQCYRTVCSLAPLQMNSLQSLSIPKETNRFTKTRKSTISCSCSRMIIGMISSLNQNSKGYSQQPIIYTKHSSHKRQVQSNQRYTVPSFNRRCQIKRKIKIHLYE